jgi:hypothetical protein
MYRRDDEKLHCRDGEQAEHFSASQGAEHAGFSAQDGSEDRHYFCICICISINNVHLNFRLNFICFMRCCAIILDLH